MRGTRYTGMMMVAGLAAAGCYEVELEVPVVTQVATVEGNPVLFKANATLHGQILEPADVKSNFGMSEKPVEEVRLMDFQVRVTDDAVEGPTDQDDLLFVESMVIYVESLDPNSKLKQIAVAWYYADEADGLDADSIVFETDPEMDLTPYVRTGFKLSSSSVSRVPGDNVSVEGLATFTALPGY